MADRDAFPLHVVAAHGRRIEQHVNQVVVEKVDFIHVEDAPVGGGDETRLKAAGAGLDGLLDVERPDEPVLGGPYRQVDDAHLPVDRRGFHSATLAKLA